MRRRPAALSIALLCAVCAQVHAADFAYESEADTDNNGRISHSRTISDGTRTKATWSWDDGTTGGNYIDRARGLGWVWSSMSKDCSQFALRQPGATPPAHLDEKEIGRETIDGHPTRKFSYRVEHTFAGKTSVDSITEWRATDLHDFVLRTQTDQHRSTQVRKIILRAPAPAEVAFASTPCKYNPVNDDTAYAAAAPGGFRNVRFFDLGCKKIVPLGIKASLPSDYEIRLSPHFGCFAGTHEDLDRVLAKADEVDFEAITRGVIWTRIATSAEFRASTRRFFSEHGSDEGWDHAIAAAGGRDVHIERGDLAGRPSIRVTARMQGRTARMCYLGVADSPAILVSYQAPARTTSADDNEWRRFLGALREDRNEMADQLAPPAK